MVGNHLNQIYQGQPRNLFPVHTTYRSKFMQQNMTSAGTAGNESITLYCQEGGSDKVYQVVLAAVDGGYTLMAHNGARGKALKAQPKIVTPAPYAVAKKEFDALVRSKMKKGYKSGNAAADYVATNLGERSGLSIQLLMPAPESDIERFLTDDAFIAQQKFDGERRPVARRAEVVGGNSTGFMTSMPRALLDDLAKLPFGTELDAEAIGETLYVFDAMKVGGTDIRDMGVMDRFEKASQMVCSISSQNVVIAETAVGTQAKRELYERLRATRQEGIVFKRRASPYREGRNGDQIKVKFVESATLEVSSAHPTKRSITVQGYAADGAAVPLGSVTVPSNYAIPAVGEIVEVLYLYVVNSLFQPVFKGVRTDKTRAACSTTQLKYRADIGEDE